MNVIYDISFLGQNFFWTKAGIYRVAENLAIELAKSPECDLTFCASLSVKAWKQSLSYLKENNSHFQHISFISQNEKTNVTSNLYDLCQKTIKSTHKLGFRRTRILESTFVSLISLFFEPIELKDLTDKQIYHSPHSRIPEIVNQCKHIQKFLTVHDLLPLLYPQYFVDDQRTELKEIFRTLNSDSWIFCVSEAVKNDLCNYLKTIDPAKVSVTYLGASDLFYPCLETEKIAFVKQKYKIPDDSNYILSVSTLEPRKNTVHTIRSFAKLIKQENINDLYLVLVGKKYLDAPRVLTEISNDPLLRERVIMTDYVADEDLPALYSGALVFVYLPFCEGFGLPPLEAMQCGTPAITSNTTSLPEVVGEAGIILDPQDSDGLCHNILQIYNSPSWRDTLSLKSLEQAKKFSWSNCIKQTIAGYKKSLL